MVAQKKTLMPTDPDQKTPPVDLIAHRGFTARYPENTIAGIAAAVEAGARWVEFDIQLSADGVPVLMHDATLVRTTGQPGTVMDLPMDELRNFAPCEPDRFGDRFADVRIASVADLIRQLATWPDVTVFAEIKKESIDRFGSRYTVARVLEALQPCMQQCVVISFVAEAIAQARELGMPRVGWAIRQFNNVIRQEATLLAPEFLFCDHEIIPAASKKNPHPLWTGPWRWAVYEVGNPELALRLAGLGANLIETFDIGSLIRHPQLAPA